jgi:hypothetical protein
MITRNTFNLKKSVVFSLLFFVLGLLIINPVFSQEKNKDIVSIFKQYYSDLYAADSIDDQVIVEEKYATASKIKEMTDKMPKTQQEKQMLMIMYNSMIKPMMILPEDLDFVEVNVTGDMAIIKYKSLGTKTIAGESVLKNENNQWKVEKTTHKIVDEKGASSSITF